MGFTVPDADRSAAWYQDVFEMQLVLQSDEDGVAIRILAHPGSGWIMGLREHPDQPGGPFDERRTGLDHLAFTVTSRGELDAWESELERRGISYTPIQETPIGTVIAFRDPDNIQLWLPVGS